MLIATIGNSPQVVTLALDELLRRGVNIRRVLVVQPTETLPKIEASLDRLRDEVSFYKKKGILFDFRVFEGKDGHRPIDTLDERDAQAVLQTLYREIKAAKADNWRIHLSIAGGRKVISALGTIAAQLHFDDDDCCWHVADNDGVNKLAMHPAPGELVTLVEVPYRAWKWWKHMIADSLALALTDDPFETEQMLRHLEDKVQRAQKLRDFYFGDLNYTEQRILALLALKGLSKEAIGAQLDRVVKNNVTDIATKYSNAFKIDADAWRLIADFQQIMLALEFRGELPNLTPTGATKEAREAYQARNLR